MNEETSAAAPEGRNGSQGGETAIGRTLREARQAANIDVNKICSDLRIAPQALDALEQGNYHLLPGDPYIRALLGSLGRYLNLDPISLVQGYNKEIGAVHAAPSIAPYKDRTQKHTATHKQIFIGIFAVLFIVLFLLFRKLNVNDSDPAKAVPPPANSGVADTLTPAQDTLLESKSLAPDSTGAKASPDTGETRGSVRGAARPSAAVPPSTMVPPAAPGSSTASAPVSTGAIDSSHLTLALVKPLIDSVWVKVARSGKEDFGTVLRLGKQMQVSHTDTIVVTISKKRSVEVTIGGKTVIPDKRRFKIYGTNLKTF
ncbi:MAG: transcriptional regulator, family [Fibrobacteres bacterium]|nr:transcriptional regulator, family [Fibrobacterota bacterium]